MRPTVAIIGGGYGGVRAARMLDELADVVLVEPKDTFVHNVAALRGLTDPGWTDTIFLPYERLLRHGRVVRDRATLAEPGAVTLASGARLEVDYLVLATGTSYPFPAKMDLDRAAAAKDRLRRTRDELARSHHVLLLGAGPVGLELAAEIRTVWPDKRITIVDPATDVLAGEYRDELRGELRRQLADLDVGLRLGSALRQMPPTPPGVSEPFDVVTESGTAVAADIWFRCFGSTPVTDYLSDELASSRQPDGRLQVTPELRLPGQDAVFAIGDITAIPEPKQGAAADAHGQVVAANIAALIQHDGPLQTYEPDAPAILVPLGADGGASQLPDGVVGAETTAAYKGKNLLVDDFLEVLGLAEADPSFRTSTASD